MKSSRIISCLDASASPSGDDDKTHRRAKTSKKKGKKGPRFCFQGLSCCVSQVSIIRVAVILNPLAERSSSLETSASTSPVEMEDLIRVFGVGQRDLGRGGRMTSLADLNPRQLALVLAPACGFITAADLLDVGGEPDIWKHDYCCDILAATYETGQ